MMMLVKQERVVQAEKGQLERIINGLLYTAISNQDEEYLKTGLEKLYSPYKQVFGKYSYEKEELLKAEAGLYFSAVELTMVKSN